VPTVLTAVAALNIMLLLFVLVDLIYFSVVFGENPSLLDRKGSADAGF